MFQPPGLWLIRCPRCGTWFWFWPDRHTVRDCYTKLPYRDEVKRRGLPA